MAKRTTPNTVAPRDALDELAKAFKLSKSKAERLFQMLRDLENSHRAMRSLETLARAGSFEAKLLKIHKSLRTIARFSREVGADEPAPTDRIILAHLENAAHKWAARVRLDDDAKSGEWERRAAPHGFVLGTNVSQGYPIPSFNEAVFVKSWLQDTSLLAGLIEDILRGEAKRRKQAKSPDVGNELSAIERLSGIRLPELYEEYTGRSYGFSFGSDQKLLLTTGPKFVTMCFAIMGIQSPGLETLKTHRQKAKKWLERNGANE